MSDKYSVQQAVADAIMGKALDFEGQINGILAQKQLNAVEAKREELAAGIFNDGVPHEGLDSEEEQADGGGSPEEVDADSGDNGSETDSGGSSEEEEDSDSLQVPARVEEDDEGGEETS